MYIDFYLLFLATSPVTLFLLDLVKVKKIQAGPGMFVMVGVHN